MLRHVIRIQYVSFVDPPHKKLKYITIKTNSEEAKRISALLSKTKI